MSITRLRHSARHRQTEVGKGSLPKEEFDTNSFEAVLYPDIDPLFTRTEGQTQKLIRTALDEHRPRHTAHRLYALLLTLYGMCLRIEAELGARIENLRYDAGLHVMNVEAKGGYWVEKRSHRWCTTRS
ncbi:hypothetical protein [Streptomyces sp. ok210]|uniref:hypothetical protein n=1 Tax=Streptomyces sp. ok210 TaxID=1761905 RepID=UPI0008EA3BBE|nr:hypothetical protein [Streptomyces sp. ok210]SFT21400.1 hypothetical protein SAMN04487982_11075 [Streptomyces sp. ok210]